MVRRQSAKLLFVGSIPTRAFQNLVGIEADPSARGAGGAKRHNSALRKVSVANVSEGGRLRGSEWERAEGWTLHSCFADGHRSVSRKDSHPRLEFDSEGWKVRGLDG